VEKLEMRIYVSELETRVDRALHKWKKASKIENGEVVQIIWQFEQAHVTLDVFWHDGAEHVELETKWPKMRAEFEWTGLTVDTADRVMDRVGNFAQTVQWKGLKGLE